MGNTYGFCKVRKDVFKSGKSRFIMDESDEWVDDYSPEYETIIGELDREDFLYSLVKPTEGWLDKLEDKELAEYIRTKFKPEDEQAIVVTQESVQHAIDVLTELDKRVASMPCDKSEKGETTDMYKQYLEPDKWGYVEDKSKDPDDPYDTDKVYVSSCKENVDIYKEVEKVYHHRTYHYGFPWNKGWRFGASYVIECLMDVMKEMKNPENKDYVFLFDWI